MKISEMNKILKEMKEIVKFDDKETIYLWKVWILTHTNHMRVLELKLQ